MRELNQPRHLPLVEVVGLSLTVLAFIVPEARHRWLLHLVQVLYFYCMFWSLVDLHQRGLLNKSVREIYQESRRTGQRTRFSSTAFGFAGMVLLIKYL